MMLSLEKLGIAVRVRIHSLATLIMLTILISWLFLQVDLHSPDTSKTGINTVLMWGLKSGPLGLLKKDENAQRVVS